MLKITTNRSKIKRIFKTVSSTMIIQIAIQLLSIVGGILVIRFLPVKDYAYYTITYSMLGAMNILSNGGIISGTLGEGAKVYDDRKKLGAVIATGLHLRKLMSIISLGISSAVLIYLLIKNEASWITSVLLTIAVIPSFYTTLSSTIFEIPMKLHQDTFKLQKNQLASSVGRIVFMGSLLVFPFAPVAILADGIPRFFANLKLKKMSAVYYDHTEKKSDAIQHRLVKIMKHVLPVDVYNIFSSQISIWVLSFFGTVISIGQLGALYRIGAITNIFSVAFAILIVPRYIRLKLTAQQNLKYILAINLLLIAICIMLLVLVQLFSTYILKILGNQYAGLNYELVLVMIMFCFNFSSSIIYNINISKGCVINPLILILMNLLAVITGAFVFNFAKLSGAIYYSIYISIVVYGVNLFYSFFSQYKKIKSV